MPRPTKRNEPARSSNSRRIDMNGIKPIHMAVFALLLIGLSGGCFYVVEPGDRGVRVTLGEMSEEVLAPGFGFKMPLATTIRRITVRQITRETMAECFSLDLQQIDIRLKLL